MSEDSPNYVIKVDHGHRETHHTLIVPGRRALGEQWRKVTIGADADRVTVDSQPHEAPADGKPIMVMGSGDEGYIQDVVETQMGKALGRLLQEKDDLCTTRPCNHDGPGCGRWQYINQLWHDYIEQKLRWLRGQTTIGPGGVQQRQTVAQNPVTRPWWFKE